MAKRKHPVVPPLASAAAPKRRRRTPEELIADLERQIEAVKTRAAARSLTAAPSVRAALAAVRALDKALALAEQERDTVLRHALADAREPLAGDLTRRGARLAKTRPPKGPRPK